MNGTPAPDGPAGEHPRVDEKRVLQSVLRLLADGGQRDPAAEMAREVLSGRMSLQQAGNSLAYGELLAQTASDAMATMDSTSPQQRAEAEALLSRAADILDPPPAEQPTPRARPCDPVEDDWDESLASPWDDR